MARPTNFPKGLSTFPPRSTLATYPIATSPNQIAYTEDFLPYRSGDYTVTTAVAGTVTQFNWLGGMVRLNTSASATDTIYLYRNGTGFKITPNGQAWFNARVAYPRSVANSNDTDLYVGVFNNATLTSATDGIFFYKPAGGTSVNLVIRKGSTSTVFQNIADLAKPSGLYGDSNAVNGVLRAVVAGNAFTGVSVVTPGAGYMCMPLVLTTSGSGAAGNVPVMCGLASTAYSSSNPSVPISSTQLPYSSLNSPYITAGGSGYTNSAGSNTYLEVEPFIDLAFYFNGNGWLYVGVNGRTVMSLGGDAVSMGQTGVAAGSTTNLASSAAKSFNSTTQLSTAVCPVQPAAGSAFNLLPLVNLAPAAGFANTTANIRQFYLAELNVAAELN